MSIVATDVRFIKLGQGGCWESGCIDNTKPTIRLGFDSPLHQTCLDGDWESVAAYWKKKHPREATKIVNQTKDFYTLGSKTMWITFYDRKLYWCFAQPKVIELEPGGSRVRKVTNRWNCEDNFGNVLFLDSLSGKLTRVVGFRGTICKVHEWSYLLSRIKGESQEDTKKAETAFESLTNALVPLIQKLNWKDFELLVDFIFSRGGWQRRSRLGGTEKSIDLELMSPVIGRRTFVQVKSEASMDDLKKSIAAFQKMKQFQEMFFVVHTARPKLREHAKSEKVNFLGLEELAPLVVDSGISHWLIDKAR